MSWSGMCSLVCSPMEEAYGSREMTPRMIPDLIDIEQELFELPQKVRLASALQMNEYANALDRNA